MTPFAQLHPSESGKMAESQKKGGGFKKFFKLKGFGSLSSIPRSFAFRRVYVAPRLAETEGGLNSPNGFLTLSFESTQDDLGTGPKSPSRYARSCNMFSHMGTMPRGSSRQKVGAHGPDKALEPTLPSAPPQTGSPPPGEGPEQKEKGRQSSSVNVGPGCSQKVTLQAEDSSKRFLEPGEISSLGTKEKPKQIGWDYLQGTSRPIERAQEDLQGVPSGPSRYAQSCNVYSHLGTMPRARAGPSKSPIQEKPTKTQHDLAQDLPAKAIPSCAETAEKASEEHLEQRHPDGLGSSSEYVKFSKEKYILDSSPEKLHKELEEELKLSSSDLRSHAWYHGRIPREVRS